MVADAGSGKTTSLVKALTHLGQTRRAELKARGQRVACITYTEVAVKEIWGDVGNDPLFHVSTIHSFLWTVVPGSRRQPCSNPRTYWTKPIWTLPWPKDVISGRPPPTLAPASGYRPRPAPTENSLPCARHRDRAGGGLAPRMRGSRPLTVLTDCPAAVARPIATGQPQVLPRVQ